MTATTTVLAQIQLHWKQDAFWYLKIDKKIDEKEKKQCEHTLKTYDYSIVYTATGGFFGEKACTSYNIKYRSRSNNKICQTKKRGKMTYVMIVV